MNSAFNRQAIDHAVMVRHARIDPGRSE
jgi:hypothetical protein